MAAQAPGRPGPSAIKKSGQVAPMVSKARSADVTGPDRVQIKRIAPVSPDAHRHALVSCMHRMPIRRGKDRFRKPGGAWTDPAMEGFYTSRNIKAIRSSIRRF